MILFAFVYTILTVIISGGRHDQLTWYRYPIYPFMSIAIALMVKDLVSNPSFLKNAVFIPLFLANIDLLENPFWKTKFLTDVKFYRYAFLALLVPSIIYLVFPKRVFINLSRWAIIAALAFGLFINTWVVTSRFNLLCDHSSECALPAKVNLMEPFLKFLGK